jgi:hypothetical protein
MSNKDIQSADDALRAAIKPKQFIPLTCNNGNGKEQLNHKVESAAFEQNTHNISRGTSYKISDYQSG